MLEFILVILTGLIVGTINGMSGGASIISYPVLLALGLHPINAAVTNALGVSSANIFAINIDKTSAKKLFRAYRPLIALSVLCSAIGATLLLLLPSRIFEHIVPFLLLGATLTLLLPTKIKVKKENRTVEALAIGASGLYNGYFGPGQGVMVVAALAHDPNRDTRTTNTAKNIIVSATSMVSNVIYLFSGRANWLLVLALFIGSSLGGTLGGKWATKMSPLFYRGLAFIVGIGASIWLFIRYFF